MNGIKLGLKSAADEKQLNARFALIDDFSLPQPEIIELHLSYEDLENKKLEEIILSLGEHGVEVMLHSPEYKHPLILDPASKDTKTKKETAKVLRILEELCNRFPHVSGYVVHPYNGGPIGYIPINHAKEKRMEIIKFFGENKFDHNYIYFENVPRKVFAKSDEINFILDGISQSTGQKPLFCLDFSHLYITYLYMTHFFDVSKYYRVASKLMDRADYCHINDAFLFWDSRKIGKGSIDFSKLPLTKIKKGVIEVISKREMNPKALVESYKTFLQLYEKQRQNSDHP